MLEESANRLLAVASDPQTPNQEIQPWISEFFAALGNASAEDAAQGMSILSQGISLEDSGRAGLFALLCGAMVENGHDPTPMVDPLLNRLRLITARAHQFHEAWMARCPPELDDQEQLDALRETAAAEMPELAENFELLEKFFPPAIAMFSMSPTARNAAQDLLPVLAPMSNASNGASWISSILRVLHNEPYVAIEPATGLGIEGTMSGISINFQLNVLLMDAFPQKGFFKKRRVSQQAAAVARGQGPQQSDETIFGSWNLYTWRALRRDMTLPNGQTDTDHWIWNEGTPADIPLFEGKRVILLGPPAYERSRGSQRDFAALRADLTIDHHLSPDQVKTFLHRIVSAS